MPHKEHYRHTLPHYQQPGQAYFVTWCLKNAVPAHALKKYTQQLSILKSQLNTADRNPLNPGAADSHPPFNKADGNPLHPDLKQQYYALRYKYIKAFNKLLDANKNLQIDLSKPELTKVIINALQFWEGKRLKSHAFCIMPNHVHWVVQLFEKDEAGNPVYLEDILKSVKQFSATQINRLENKEGKLWQKESFETTIRDHKHLHYAIEYTHNNPTNSGLVQKRKDWPGSG